MKSSGNGALYGIGVLGALVYYMQQAGSFMEVITGIFKAIFWPGVVLYRVLEMLNL